ASRAPRPALAHAGDQQVAPPRVSAVTTRARVTRRTAAGAPHGRSGQGVSSRAAGRNAPLAPRGSCGSGIEDARISGEKHREHNSTYVSMAPGERCWAHAELYVRNRGAAMS